MALAAIIWKRERARTAAPACPSTCAASVTCRKNGIRKALTCSRCGGANRQTSQGRGRRASAQGVASDSIRR